jgi:hypothetical protein
MDKQPITESEVRKLRADCYGECSDKNWDETGANWMRADSVDFLKKHTRPITI